MVFAECGIGAIVLTFNAILLGGEIVFFQALCLLGYCLFPICVSSIVCAIVGNKSGAHSNCYEILGIGTMATPEQIRSAYLRMASKTHPDRGGNAEDFMKVQAAFDTLYHIARQRSSQLVP
ncbi:protein YIPF, partial [Haematococcus lacustris]